MCVNMGGSSLHLRLGILGAFLEGYITVIKHHGQGLDRCLNS